eukprot:449253-Lingulodinium_polyedra.AAC.1
MYQVQKDGRAFVQFQQRNVFSLTEEECCRIVRLLVNWNAVGDDRTALYAARASFTKAVEEG